MRRLKKFSRQLRKKQTDPEGCLWFSLRSRRLLGYKFRRQHPIGNYIVDFVCLDAKVIVELDGSQHLMQVSYDQKRDSFLKMNGYNVLRFHNNEFLDNLDSVLDLIAQALLVSPHSNSLPQGERGPEGAKDE